MRLRQAKKIVMRCRQERERRGELYDYTKRKGGLAPYKEHTVKKAIIRLKRRRLTYIETGRTSCGRKYRFR